MPDTEVADNVDTGLETGGDQHWGVEHIKDNAELAEWSKKFTNISDMAVSGRTLEQKQSSSFRLPDDLASLTDEQRTDLVSKVQSLNDLPENAAGYEITVPEGITRDENFESAFKEFAFEGKMSKGLVQQCVDFYTTAQKAGEDAKNQKLEQDASAAEIDYRTKCGVEYDQKMEDIKTCRLRIAEDLGLGYRDGTKDENGNEVLKSKFDDAMDMVDVNGRKLGNNPAIMQFMSYAFEKLFKPAVPVDGAGSKPGAGGDDSVLSAAFYANPTK